MSRLKKSVPPILIVSSIVLLIVFQFFWLRGVFREAEGRFRREASTQFHATVISLYDSLIQGKIQPMPGSDTLYRFNVPPKLTLREMRPLVKSMDSGGRFHYTERQSRVEIFVTGNDSNSIPSSVKPLIKRIEKEKGKSFILRLGPDSIKLDTIRKHFAATLDQAGLNVGFRIRAIRDPELVFAPPIEQPEWDIVRINPFNRYAVNYLGVDAFILRTITPQIIFSVILTLVTAGAFYVMYRNLRTQEKLMRLKNDFISNVTHELKTPVATVSVALEALKNFNALNDTRKTNEYLEIAQSELSRLTLMTDKILKTSVFENGTVITENEAVDLRKISEQVISSMKLIVEKRKIDLRLVTEGTEFTVAGSLTDLSNVLYNLVDNALKYSPDGSSIKVTLTENGGRVQLAVSDTGIGIPAEYKSRIFEKFFRVPSGDVHNVKGYGLGLSYVATVIKAHHGTIRVDSEAGKGSTFVIHLPKRS